MSPELEALGRTLRVRFTMHMNTGPAHIYAHDIIDPSGRVIGKRSKYSRKKSAPRVIYTMGDTDYETTEQFLTAYRDKLRDQEWESAVPAAKLEG